MLILISPVRALAEGGVFEIQNVIPDKAGKLLIIGGQKQDNKITYKVVKLTDPERLVLDIENAVLKDENGKKSVNVNNKNFKEDVRIAQFSTDPNVVRVVFAAKSANILDKIKIRPYKSGIIVEFEEIELASAGTSSIYRDRDKENASPAQEITIENPDADNKEAVLNEIKEKVQNNIIINNVEKHDNRILLSGMGVISIVEPFVLDSPERIIFDISDAVLDSPDLIRTFSLKNDDEARIAQFDTRTVRIVIESKKPEQYTHALSPDLQSIIIAPEKDISFAEFPDNSSVGAIQDIKIIKDSDLTTKIILVSEKPIIHSIKRFYAPDKLHLNLYNIKKPPEEVLQILEKTPQFHGFVIEDSAWNISLNRSTSVESQLSLDGRVLKITLTDDVNTPIVTTGPLQAKIIIDPGHGGYDPGAEYNGVYEKDIVLDVSRRVKKYLDEMGFYVIMTRETDKTLSLKERVAITEKENPDVFLSIHANANNNPNIKGIETHWYTVQSRTLAMHLQNQMVNNLVIPDRGLKNSRFYVIRNTSTPAVLTEIGYMSNEIELYQLMTDERREATAKSIADGIVSYLKSKNAPADPTGRKQL